jgi:thioredoxin 1
MKGKMVSLLTFVSIMAMLGLCRADVVEDTLSNARKQGRTVMIEVGSAGCLPCEKMEPVLEKLRMDYKDRLEVLSIEVSRDRENPRRLGVTAIPTQIFVDKNGKEFHRHMGFYSYEMIKGVLKKQGL